MCYTNVLQILDLSHIPINASDRTEKDPIVIGGGPCSYNPEPIADFFDLFYIGEGETRYLELLDLYKESKNNQESRMTFLKKAAQIPGIYCPMFYEATYKMDGTIESFKPKDATLPMTINKEMVANINTVALPKTPIVPFIKVTQERVVLEIQRGCIRGCRFCQKYPETLKLQEKQ